jgi:hypothetical protein
VPATPNDIETRVSSSTLPSVRWVIDEDWEQGNAYATADITSIVQAMVDQQQDTEAMTFMLKPDAVADPSDFVRRRAFSHKSAKRDGDGTEMPKLVLAWTTTAAAEEATTTEAATTSSFDRSARSSLRSMLLEEATGQDVLGLDLNDDGRLDLAEMAVHFETLDEGYKELFAAAFPTYTTAGIPLHVGEYFEVLIDLCDWDMQEDSMDVWAYMECNNALLDHGAADTNDDGLMTAEEYAAFVAAGESYVPEWFAGMDADGSGDVTLQEWSDSFMLSGTDGNYGWFTAEFQRICDSNEAQDSFTLEQLQASDNVWVLEFFQHNYDHDDSGFASVTEWLTSWRDHSGEGYMSTSSTTPYSFRVANSLDLNSDGVLCPNELAIHFDGFSPEFKANLATTAELGETLNVAEFLAWLEDECFTGNDGFAAFTPDEYSMCMDAHNMFWYMMNPEDGVMSVEEYTAWVGYSGEHVHDWFVHLDKNQDGLVDPDEWLQTYGYLGTDVAMMELMQVCAIAGIQGNTLTEDDLHTAEDYYFLQAPSLTGFYDDGIMTLSEWLEGWRAEIFYAYGSSSSSSSSSTTTDSGCEYDYCVGACEPFVYCFTEPDAACQYTPEDCSTRCATCISGCTDPLATNYAPEAGQDDGSCMYEAGVPLSL